MYKLLNKLKDDKMLCEFYTDHDFDTFNVGVLMYLDKYWYMISDYKPNGNSDGFLCRQIETLSRVSYESKYLKKMNALINTTGFIYPFKLESDNLLMSSLKYLIKTEKICKIELFNDNDVILEGIVKNIDDDFLLVEEIDSYGVMERRSYIRLSDISCVEFDTEEQKILQKLFKA